MKSSICPFIGKIKMLTQQMIDYDEHHLLDDAIEQFSNLTKQTACPWANQSTIRYSNPISNLNEFELRMHTFDSQFSDFTLSCRDEATDMFVIAIVASLTHEVAELAKILHIILHHLRHIDTSCNLPLEEAITSPEWDFTFLDVKYFIPTFGSFYPLSHPRHSWSNRFSFIAFQPDAAFDRRGINSKNPNRARLVQKVRENFAKLGMPYSGRTIDNIPKALRYVKPLSENDDLVEWWKIPLVISEVPK